MEEEGEGLGPVEVEGLSVTDVCDGLVDVFLNPQLVQLKLPLELNRSLWTIRVRLPRSISCPVGHQCGAGRLGTWIVEALGLLGGSGPG